MGGSDSAHSVWNRNERGLQVLPDLNIDILLCFQPITYFLLYDFPDVQLDSHTKSSFVVIGASLIDGLQQSV